MLSISVDPALTLGLVRVFAALACIALSGFLLVYFAFGLRHPLTAIATALPVGLASILLVSNLLAYVVGTPRAFTVGLLAVLAIAILIAVFRRGYFRPLHSPSRLDVVLFIAAAALLLVLSVVNYAVYPVWDYFVHFWLANTIRFGNFPVMAPGAPSLHAEYHYGGPFLAAMLAHFGQMDSAVVFFILTPIAATAAYLAAAMLAAQVLGSLRLGLLAGLFFSFGGGLRLFIDPIRRIQLRWFTPDSTAASDAVSDAFSRISLRTFEAYPHFLKFPHFLLAWSILLSVMVLVVHCERSTQRPDTPRSVWLRWGLTGAFFASLALVEISIFAIGFAAWGALSLWQAVRLRRFSILGNYALAAMPAALLAIFQGGFITSVLFFSPPGGTGLSNSFEISPFSLSVVVGYPQLQFTYPPTWVAVYLTIFGVPLLAAPFLLVWAFRARHNLQLAWLAVIATAGLLVPHIIIYLHSNTLLRWAEFGHATLALLLGIGTLKIAASLQRRWLGSVLFLFCAALTVGWPLMVSLDNLRNDGKAVLGRSTEDHWTISPLHRQSDHIDWLTGRHYPFHMGTEAREFLRALPPTARVLTNRFPEVPLLIRGFAPHKNVDRFSYTNFRYPGPTYFDALYRLDPLSMQQYGITHLVINLKWIRQTDPSTHATLHNPRYFSLLFSDEESQEGFAWHRVYQVHPEFYEDSPAPSQDLMRTLAQIVPEGASVYVSPAIPDDIRWAMHYVLRERQVSGSLAFRNHINELLQVAEPQPDDAYDFALLIDEPPVERWLNWPHTPQDLPSTWGLHASQRIWHALSVGLYALDQQACPRRSLAGVPPAWQVSANTPAILDLDCLPSVVSTDERPSSILLTVLSPQTSRIEMTINGRSQTVRLESGATLIPVNEANVQQVTIEPDNDIWLRVQRVPYLTTVSPTGIAALQILPSFDGRVLRIQAKFYGDRTTALASDLVWELVKQRRIYEHWWHWDSPGSAAVWTQKLAESPGHSDQFKFALDLNALKVELAHNDQPVSLGEDTPLPQNPGEPYVLFLTFVLHYNRTLSMPVAWITYSPNDDPSVLLAPRFILLDRATQGP